MKRRTNSSTEERIETLTARVDRLAISAETGTPKIVLDRAIDLRREVASWRGLDTRQDVELRKLLDHIDEIGEHLRERQRLERQQTYDNSNT